MKSFGELMDDIRSGATLAGITTITESINEKGLTVVREPNEQTFEAIEKLLVDFDGDLMECIGVMGGAALETYMTTNDERLADNMLVVLAMAQAAVGSLSATAVLTKAIAQRIGEPMVNHSCLVFSVPWGDDGELGGKLIQTIHDHKEENQ